MPTKIDTVPESSKRKSQAQGKRRDNTCPFFSFSWMNSSKKNSPASLPSGQPLLCACPPVEEN
jgi:hypothetical protein